MATAKSCTEILLWPAESTRSWSPPNLNFPVRSPGFISADGARNVHSRSGSFRSWSRASMVANEPGLTQSRQGGIVHDPHAGLNFEASGPAYPQDSLDARLLHGCNDRLCATDLV